MARLGPEVATILARTIARHGGRLSRQRDTHRGCGTDSHLQYYLDAFMFWFNRRTSKRRRLLF